MSTEVVHVPKEEAVIVPPEYSDLSVGRAPAEVLAEAQKAAAVLHDVISKKKNPVRFNGRHYLEFEDWQTVGRFYGLTARIRESKYIEYGDARGFEAVADAVMVANGQIVSTAEAMCLNDERNWKGRTLNQIRSMAQTRACAKVLRNVLSWVVVLAGYAPTPAEEMEETQDEVKDRRIAEERAKSEQAPADSAPAGNGSGTTGAPPTASPAPVLNAPEELKHLWNEFQATASAKAALYIAKKAIGEALPNSGELEYRRIFDKYGISKPHQIEDLQRCLIEMLNLAKWAKQNGSGKLPDQPPNDHEQLLDRGPEQKVMYGD